jgi:hypothetical protein
MLIALLALLGINLGVIVILLAGVIGRRRWLSRQPGSFKGALRVAKGDVDGLSARWKRGYGRWVDGVLVWTKAPILVSNEAIAVHGVGGEPRPAHQGEVKRLGDAALVFDLEADGGGRLELAVQPADGSDALGPYSRAQEPRSR